MASYKYLGESTEKCKGCKFEPSLELSLESYEQGNEYQVSCYMFEDITICTKKIN